MMKGPRSFVSMLLLVISLAAVPYGYPVKPQIAFAGGMPRVMDPRAGDPTQPDDGPIPADSGIQEPGDDLATSAPNRFSRPVARPRATQSLATALSSWLVVWLAARRGPK